MWAGCRRTGGKQQVYIKISEAEIADDYPEPTQYDKVQTASCACHFSSRDVTDQKVHSDHLT